MVQTGLPGASVRIILFDALGRSYYNNQHVVIDGETQLDLSAAGLKPGVYFLKVIGDKQPDRVVKLLKQ